VTRKRRDPEQYRTASLAAGIGPIFAAGVVLGYFGGLRLDRWLDTTPWLMTLGVFLGAGVGIREVIRVLRRIEQSSGKREKRNQKRFRTDNEH
jgi:F0F1-type ATP synthase assembly protein I